MLMVINFLRLHAPNKKKANHRKNDSHIFFQLPRRDHGFKSTWSLGRTNSSITHNTISASHHTLASRLKKQKQLEKTTLYIVRNMAVTAIASHNFARLITSQVDGARIVHQEHDAADPATMDELMETASALDTEIQSIKVQKRRDNHSVPH